MSATFDREAIAMAPTNRLIEARRAELRAEEQAEKQRTAKTPPPKKQGSSGKAPDKPKS